MAQGNNIEKQVYMVKPGYLKNDIRQNCAKDSGTFKIIASTDTCDSYIWQGVFRMKCHYKNDTSYRIELIYPFDHKLIKDGFGPPYKKLGNNLWVLYDEKEGVEMKLSFNGKKDLMIVNVETIKIKK